MSNHPQMPAKDHRPMNEAATEGPMCPACGSPDSTATVASAKPAEGTRQCQRCGKVFHPGKPIT